MTHVANLRPIIQRKDPVFPCDVPIEVLLPNWRHSRWGVITRNPNYHIPGNDGYHLTITQGRYRGNIYPMCIGDFVEIRLNGEAWDCCERE